VLRIWSVLYQISKGGKKTPGHYFHFLFVVLNLSDGSGDELLSLFYNKY